MCTEVCVLSWSLQVSVQHWSGRKSNYFSSFKMMTILFCRTWCFMRQNCPHRTKERKCFIYKGCSLHWLCKENINAVREPEGTELGGGEVAEWWFCILKNISCKFSTLLSGSKNTRVGNKQFVLTKNVTILLSPSFTLYLHLRVFCLLIKLFHLIKLWHISSLTHC